MTDKPRSTQEVVDAGYELLRSQLGAVDTIRFIREIHGGRGDYTAERQQWVGSLALEQILESIEEMRRDGRIPPGT